MDTEFCRFRSRCRIYQIYSHPMGSSTEDPFIQECCRGAGSRDCPIHRYHLVSSRSEFGAELPASGEAPFLHVVKEHPSSHLSSSLLH